MVANDKFRKNKENFLFFLISILKKDLINQALTKGKMEISNNWEFLTTNLFSWWYR